MAWSNIFCQIIGATGPVIGEGLLAGWQTSIELTGFNWAMQVESSTQASGFGAAMKRAAITALPVRPLTHVPKFSELEITKRFDIASADIHMLMDLELPILSVSITVLHIAPGGTSFHTPGFVLLATDCKVTKVKEEMTPTDKGVEVKETVTIDYNSLTLTYLRPLPFDVLGKQPVPMPPFFVMKRAPVNPSNGPI